MIPNIAPRFEGNLALAIEPDEQQQPCLRLVWDRDANDHDQDEDEPERKTALRAKSQDHEDLQALWASKDAKALRKTAVLADDRVGCHTITGKEHDKNTGLVYFGARYYDPEVGRFISQDPYLGEPNTPPSLHRYLYAYSNPTVYIDLEGYAGTWADTARGAKLLGGLALEGQKAINEIDQAIKDYTIGQAHEFGNLSKELGQSIFSGQFFQGIWDQEVVPWFTEPGAAWDRMWTNIGMAPRRAVDFAANASQQDWQRLNARLVVFGFPAAYMAGLSAGSSSLGGSRIALSSANPSGRASVARVSSRVPAVARKAVARARKPLPKRPDFSAVHKKNMASRVEFKRSIKTPKRAANAGGALVRHDPGFAAVQARGVVRKGMSTEVKAIRELDPEAAVGFRGSLARGRKGPHKGSVPFDSSNFDVDAFIVSDELAARYPGGSRWRSGSRIPEIHAAQQRIGKRLRKELPGLREEPFTFRIYTRSEFAKKVGPDEIHLIK